MSLEVYLNNKYYLFQNLPFHQDTLRISCSLECDDDNNRNSIVLWSVNPRSNISNIMYISNLAFDDEIQDETFFGSLETEMFMCYHKSDMDMIPLEFTTCGNKILQVVINFPPRNKKLLREIKCIGKEKFQETCCICYEKKKNNIMVDEYHFFCQDCLLQLESDECPICRSTMIV